MVKSLSLLASALFVFLSADKLCAGPVELRCEYLHQPLGIDVPAPRFSWQSDSSERNWAQSAYELLVASKPELLAEGTADVWDSGRVRSDNSVGIVYAGPRLKPKTRYFWTVKVWDSNGRLVRLRPGDLVGNRFVCRGLVGSEVDFVAGPGGRRRPGIRTVDLDSEVKSERHGSGDRGSIPENIQAVDSTSEGDHFPDRSE